MKITAKKNVDHREIVTYQDRYEVRVQIKKGQIITLVIEVEDGEFQFSEGKSKKDKSIIDELPSATQNYIDQILEEHSWD